jgi:hypothetical protein
MESTALDQKCLVRQHRPRAFVLPGLHFIRPSNLVGGPLPCGETCGRSWSAGMVAFYEDSKPQRTYDGSPIRPGDRRTDVMRWTLII